MAQKKKIEFDCKWYEWGIEFECECGQVIPMTDGSEQPMKCDMCPKKYRFNIDKWEVQEVGK